MKTFARNHFALSSLVLLLAACSEGGPEARQSAELGQSEQALSAFDIDTTALARRPSGKLPSERLTLAAFTDAALSRTLVGSDEAFEHLPRTGSLEVLESPSWRIEVDRAGGALVAVRDAASGPAVPQDELELERRSRLRLKAWGIGTGELGRVSQERLMRTDEEAGKVETPALSRYKTFAFRAIDAIPVEGHRAVMTYTPDGAFQRVLVAWPALAPSGHRLKSSEPIASITARAEEALLAAGEIGGKVRLSWKYVPTPRADGSVTLLLQVSARLDGGAAEEARVIDVPVNAQ